MAGSGTKKAGDVVEQTYARALLDLAHSEGQQDAVGQELRDLQELLGTHPRLLDLLGSKVIPVSERLAVVERVFHGQVSDLLYRFLRTACRKDRLDVLPGVIDAYFTLLDEMHGIVHAEVHVAKPLSNDQSTQVAAAVGRMVGRRVQLRQVVNPQMIGGLKIRVGDRLIDGSVTTRLKLMRDNLIAVGDHKARAELESLVSSNYSGGQQEEENRNDTPGARPRAASVRSTRP